MMYYAVFTKNEFVADYCDGKEAYKSAKDLGNKYGREYSVRERYVPKATKKVTSR